MPGSALSLPEREEIGHALTLDATVSWSLVAERVGRHRTTIAREVARNGGRDHYRPALADRRAARCVARPRQRLLQQPGDLRDRVTSELREGRSPYAIYADLAAEGVTARPCLETIYRAVYAGILEVKATECLRMRRPRRRHRRTRNPSTRPALPNIGGRPANLGDRTELGHWEADQIIGAHNRSSMLSLTERVTRYLILVTMPEGYTADAMIGGLVDGLDRIPTQLLRSVTFDQGSEWARWPVIAEHYEIDAWFCEPHSPWQRGQIENLNRQARWWFPRGTDLAGIEPDHADHAAHLINNQRRRGLDGNSPAMLYAAASNVH
jgi:transposase, IS30 family